MSWAAWALVAMANGVAFHFVWWLHGLDGRCRRHLRCIARRHGVLQ